MPGAPGAMPGGRPMAPKVPKSSPGAPKKLSVPSPCTAETAAASAGAKLPGSLGAYGLAMPGGGRRGCGERPGAGPVRRSPRSMPGGARTPLASPISGTGMGLMGLMGLMAFGLTAAALLGAGGGGMEGGGGNGMDVDSSACIIPPLG